MIKEKVIDYLKESFNCGIDKLEEDKTFSESGFDEIDMVNTLLDIEIMFDIEITDKECYINNCFIHLTLDGFIKLIESKI